MQDSVLLIVLIWIVNCGISFWNAMMAGVVWVEFMAMGGWNRLLVWMVALMSGIGFSWCFLIVIVFGLHHWYPHLMDTSGVKAALSLGYLLLVSGLLCAGFVIWLDSLAQAWRERDAPSIGAAAWNTYAQLHNTYEAIDGIPDAFREVASFFLDGVGSSDDEIGVAGVCILAVVVGAFGMGICTTVVLIKRFAGTVPLPTLETSQRMMNA